MNVKEGRHTCPEQHGQMRPCGEMCGHGTMVMHRRPLKCRRNSKGTAQPSDASERDSHDHCTGGMHGGPERHRRPHTCRQRSSHCSIVTGTDSVLLTPGSVAFGLRTPKGGGWIREPRLWGKPGKDHIRPNDGGPDPSSFTHYEFMECRVLF